MAIIAQTHLREHNGDFQIHTERGPIYHHYLKLILYYISLELPPLCYAGISCVNSNEAAVSSSDNRWNACMLVSAAHVNKTVLIKHCTGACLKLILLLYQAPQMFTLPCIGCNGEASSATCFFGLHAFRF